MTDAVSATWIELQPGFGAHLVQPPGGRGPGLLLWPEIFGVNPHIRGVAAQYALAGFTVMAPDVFWRQAPRVELGYEGEERQRAMALVQAYTPAQAEADVACAAAALRAHPACSGRVGALGYCMGGRMAYLSAVAARVDAAVAYYGGGIQGLLDRAPALDVPLLLHYAEHDDHIPPEAVQRVRAALGARGAALHVYAGTRHGFNCWARGSWHAPAAALAQGRTLEFLARHLHAA